MVQLDRIDKRNVKSIIHVLHRDVEQRLFASKRSTRQDLYIELARISSCEDVDNAGQHPLPFPRDA